MLVKGHSFPTCLCSWLPLGPPGVSSVFVVPRLRNPVGTGAWFSGHEHTTYSGGGGGGDLLAGRLGRAVTQPTGLLHCHQLLITVWHTESPLCCMLW